MGAARPGKAFAADADPITHRPAVAERQIEIAILGIDRDRAGLLVRRIWNQRAGRLHVPAGIGRKTGLLDRLALSGLRKMKPQKFEGMRARCGDKAEACGGDNSFYSKLEHDHSP